MPLAILAALALGACASAPPCQPLTIVVKGKDQQTLWRREPAGLFTTGTGYVRQTYRDVLETEYWLKDAEGRSHRVAEATWRAAEVGSSVEVCR